MLADALGITETLPPPFLAVTTLPQLRFILRRQGRLRWPRAEQQFIANFQPNEEGVKRIIQTYRTRLGNGQVKLTPEEEERQLAFNIRKAEFLGEPLEQAQQAPQTQPIPDLDAETARAIIAWAASDDCPEDVYARDVAPYLQALRVTAAENSS